MFALAAPASRRRYRGKLKANTRQGAGRAAKADHNRDV